MSISAEVRSMFMTVASVTSLACLSVPTTALAADDAGSTTMAASYDGAAISNLDGGVNRSSTYVGNLHIRALSDLERAFGWSDTRFFIDALWIHGGRPDARVGDALGVSSIAGPPGVQIEELWVERNFATTDVSLLAGLYDVNSEFYRVQSAGLFLNSAFGIGPEFSQSGIEGPSIFPRTSVGARFAWKPTANSVLRTAVLDGVPLIRPNDHLDLFAKGDGLEYIAEVALFDRPVEQDAPGDRRVRIGRNAMLPAYGGKIAIGAWHYTTLLNRFDRSSAKGRGTSGAYVVGDQTLARDATIPDRRLSAFLQLGIADDRTNRFGSYLGVGLVAAGPIRARPEDELGLSVAIARNGSAYQEATSPPGGAARVEATVELTYLAQATTWLAVQPDLQYVIHPNTDRGLSNAVVFTIRFEIATPH